MAETTVAAANGQTHRLPGEAGTAKLIRKLSTRLLEVDREIKDLDKEITALFRTHPSAKIIESMPGMGPGLGSEFLVITGGNINAFRDAGKLASYAGLVPVPRDSGRITGNLHRPKRYSRRLRRVFFMAALSSLKTQGPSREFYDRKTRPEYDSYQGPTCSRETARGRPVGTAARRTRVHHQRARSGYRCLTSSLRFLSVSPAGVGTARPKSERRRG